MPARILIRMMTKMRQKNNTFNEQFECDISKSGDNFDIERPDEIEENQVRSITYVTNIEDDHKDLKTLFSDAKEGRWEKVWDKKNPT